MKKLLLISLVFVGCQKQKTCIRCVNEQHSDPTERVFEGCKGDQLHEATDMASLVRQFTGNGYECETYID
jgi:hypothetical protein